MTHCAPVRRGEDGLRAARAREQGRLSRNVSQCLESICLESLRSSRRQAAACPNPGPRRALRVEEANIRVVVGICRSPAISQRRILEKYVIHKDYMIRNTNDGYCNLRPKYMDNPKRVNAS